jgi:hypothetical protein
MSPTPTPNDAAAREISEAFLVYGDEDANARLREAVHAALVAAEHRGAEGEREACLMDCSKVADDASAANGDEADHYHSGVEDGADKVADRVRARSRKGAA